MKKIFFLLGSILLTSCTSTPLYSGAADIRFMQSQPKGCKYLGEETGNQGNLFTGPLTSNANLEIGARNDLKNKAYLLGGNVVVLLTEKTGTTKGKQGTATQTNFTLTGAVLKCPDLVLAIQ